MENIVLDFIGRSIIWSIIQNHVTGMQWEACALLAPTISSFSMQELERAASRPGGG